MNRRQFVRTSALATAGAMAARFALGQATRPNIVLIHADDLGWTDLGCYGSGYYETPNIDRLRSEGVKFTDAYSPAANCAPSRACMLSGQYVPRHGVYAVGGKRRFDTNAKLLKWDERKLLAPENAPGLPAEKITFAEVLKASGYACGVFGKWHLGGGAGQTPKEQGFDTSVTMTGGKHFDFECKPMPEEVPGPDDYLSDHMADEAMKFIEDNRNDPFMLYLPDYLVHVPLEAKQELIAKYEAKAPAGGHHNPTYAAMIESLDHSAGRVLSKIDELSLRDDTLVIFYSDNGGVGSPDNRGLNRGGKITSVYPLRGMKGMLYEGGIRVPMIARWPGRIEPGSECEEPVIGVDILPTFADVAGAPTPEGQPLDGESLVPVLTRETQRLERDDIFWFMPGYLPHRQAPANVIRSRDWKLIENFEDGSLELYNLRDDIGETRDLGEDQPEKAAELHEKLRQWREDTGAEAPERNPNFDPANDGRW